MCVNRLGSSEFWWSRLLESALPSFFASMNSVGELVETILSRINIADTNELVEAAESWRGASGDAPLPDDPSRQKAWDLPIVERNWENLLRVADKMCRARFKLYCTYGYNNSMNSRMILFSTWPLCIICY